MGRERERDRWIDMEIRIDIERQDEAVGGVFLQHAL